MKKLIFFFIFNTLFIFANAQEKSPIDDYVDIIEKSNWKSFEKNISETRNIHKLMDEINTIFDRINNNPNILKNDENSTKEDKITKISNGYLKIGEEKEILIDFEEMSVDKIKYLVYKDSKKKFSLIYKEPYYVFFIDYSKTPNIYAKIKLYTLFFQKQNFDMTGYSLEDLIYGIDDNLYKQPLVKQDEVYKYERDYFKIKKFFYNTEGRFLMFRQDVEFDLRNEVLNLIFTSMSLPSPLLPLWSSTVKKFKNPQTTYEHLNELMITPNFYEVWQERHSNWVYDKGVVSLSEETKQLIEKTKKIREKILLRFSEEKRYNLLTDSDMQSIEQDITNEEKFLLIKLNRFLLEDTFPSLCPKNKEINSTKEEFVGDIKDFIDIKSVGYLMENNVYNKITIEKKLDLSNDNDSDLEKIRKQFSKSDVIILSTLCNSQTKYDTGKNLVIDVKNNLVDQFLGYMERKKTLKLKYYFDSLDNYFAKDQRDYLFSIIYEKELWFLSALYDYYKGNVIIYNKEYKMEDYKSFVSQFLKIKYSYIKANKLNLEKENWEIGISLLKIDENLFTLDFLNVEN
ncbi:MAG: hypothetical protein A2086_03010 [Spirochaetes bacterium GWD1_27_9]|nr:MAG: hypothetical protein A2Z98_14025 [Spirochaetes bacterium GWB1_27_13]OHD27414.1 MAG: hypothetical protein A2Y34_10640 [Spirochaetes bacterium GWC1_27_15]OHD31355.1 MAG: hypothetical protein A2086_03010 [Spirochaetes bacterium GWD1_27_9]